MGNGKIVALAALVTVGARFAVAQPEQFNVETVCPNPTGCTNFEVVLSGTPLINITQTLSNPALDPFTFISPSTSALTSFISPQFGGNTVVMFSGSAIPPGNIAQLGAPGGNAPHFGLFTVGNVPLTPLEDFWTWPGGGFKTLPLVTLGPNLACTLPVGDCVYLNVFLEFVGGDPQSDGMWVTYLVNPDVTLPPALTLLNFTGLPETVTNAGYFLSSALIPLDQKNIVGEPPPGQPGSPFTPDPALLGPVPVAPEPASLTIVAIGLVGTLCIAWRRKYKKAT